MVVILIIIQPLKFVFYNLKLSSLFNYINVCIIQAERERTSHFSRTDAKSRWVYQIRTQLEQRYVACRDRETLIYLIFNNYF